MSITSNTSFNWTCINTWKQSAYNTLWCLIGCSIGDIGSMLSMEIAMNIFDVAVTGEAYINFNILPFMLLVGFVTPWPYNYWRLKKYNINCH